MRSAFQGNALPGFSPEVSLQRCRRRRYPPFFHDLTVRVDYAIPAEAISQIDSYCHAGFLSAHQSSVTLFHKAGLLCTVSCACGQLTLFRETSRLIPSNLGSLQQSRNNAGSKAPVPRYLVAAILSAWSCCSAYTLASPRCRAAMPSQAERAAESVVMVGMWAMTAARRMAFSSNQGSTPWGVLMIN